ncbi:YegP family protein [Arthrobacter pascens]|uniref:YegP family protein n=1 Tax=Arthrobacter pascens TaxID=1677 RepID=UPI00358FF98E
MTRRTCAWQASWKCRRTVPGGFRFRLKAGNGEVIATGESYSSKAAAMKGVESVKNNAGSDIVDLTDS